MTNRTAAHKSATVPIRAFARTGYVYAALFSDGIVKVGKGYSPAARIRQHTFVSGMRNAVLEKSVISGRLANASEAEAMLIARCQARGEVAHGREWFRGVDFDYIEDLIRSEFPGDDETAFTAARVDQEEAADRLVSAILGPKQLTTETPEESARWLTALSHADMLSRLLVRDCYCGSLFEPDSTGVPPFVVRVSIVLCGMSADDIASIYEGIGHNPGEVIEELLARSDEIVRRYRANEVSA